jgi:hypothetical protein
MIITRRFGKKLKLPSTTEIKHQLLLRWLAEQTAKEAAESKLTSTADHRSRKAT